MLPPAIGVSWVEVAGADEDGDVPGEVAAGDTVTEGVMPGVPGVVVVAVGVTDGVGAALDVGVRVVEGAGVDVVAGGDWTVRQGWARC